LNHVIIIRKTILEGVSVSRTGRRRILRVECLEICFGTRFPNALQRAAEIMVNNAIKDT
jgi:hypothetical protein